MKKRIRFITLIIGCIIYNLTSSFAQNSQLKIYEDVKVSDVVINANQIFNIDVETHNSNNIIIQSSLEGEYKSQFHIVSNIIDQKLEISLLKNLYSDIVDNKLSAHKVIVASLTIKLPVNLNIALTSDIGSVGITGNYDDLFVELVHGQCFVTGTVKKAKINSTNGNIDIKTDNASVNAVSNNGVVHVDHDISGSSVWHITSINGNISAIKQ